MANLKLTREQYKKKLEIVCTPKEIDIILNRLYPKEDLNQESITYFMSNDPSISKD